MSVRVSPSWFRRIVLGAVLVGVVLIMGGAASADEDPARARLASMLRPMLLAELQFLEHLGWRFVTTPDVKEIVVMGGKPCSRPTLEAVLQAGDLRVLIPPGVSDTALKELGERLPYLSIATPSIAAWQHRLLIATRKAVEKLFANTEREYYIFPQFLVIDSPWWQLKPPQPEWVRCGYGWRPRCSAAQAIESFYTKRAVAECYVGQNIALFAAQYEVMGAEWFDWAYAPTDIVIGKPPVIEKTPFGWNNDRPFYHWRRALFIKGDDQKRDPGVVLGELGPVAFIGRCGILKNPNKQGYRCNENFVIMDITERAAESLRANGGFSYIQKLTGQALALRKAALAPFATAPLIEENERKIQEILAAPALSEMQFYVHPYGTQPLAELVEDKLKKQSAGVEIQLYSMGRDYAFYDRYRGTFIKRRLAEMAPQKPCPGS